MIVIELIVALNLLLGLLVLLWVVSLWWLWRRRIAAGKPTSGVGGFYEDSLRRSLPFAVLGIIGANAVVAFVAVYFHRSLDVMIDRLANGG